MGVVHMKSIGVTSARYFLQGYLHYFLSLAIGFEKESYALYGMPKTVILRAINGFKIGMATVYRRLNTYEKASLRNGSAVTDESCLNTGLRRPLKYSLFLQLHLFYTN